VAANRRGDLSRLGLQIEPLLAAVRSLWNVSGCWFRVRLASIGSRSSGDCNAGLFFLRSGVRCSEPSPRIRPAGAHEASQSRSLRIRARNLDIGSPSIDGACPGMVHPMKPRRIGRPAMRASRRL